MPQHTKMSTIDCDCAVCPRFFRIEDYASPFLARLERISTKGDGWTTLRRCPICEQHWQIDEYDKYQAGLAIKVAEPGAWLTFDDRPVRKEYLIQRRGGLGTERCIWAGCSNTVLKDSAHCPDHAYEIMGARG
jgi:hypothetical protein